MNNRQFFIARWNAERKAFVNVLKALPEGKGEYRPHPRSRSARELAWVLAMEAEAFLSFLERSETDWEDRPAPATLAEVVAVYEAASDKVTTRLGKCSDAAWVVPAKFKMGGHVAFEEPLGEMLWSFLFDAIHHRGQLSTYIRPMGGKVPSIYGPSADDSGGM